MQQKDAALSSPVINSQTKAPKLAPCSLLFFFFFKVFEEPSSDASQRSNRPATDEVLTTPPSSVGPTVLRCTAGGSLGSEGSQRAAARWLAGWLHCFQVCEAL